MYYKTRDYWEFHGNLLLKVKDIPDNSAIKFGFVFTDDQKLGHYDGMHVETEFVIDLLGDEDDQMDFRGYDIWTDERPNVMEDGADVLSLPLDRRQDFNINPVKCFKKCDKFGVCEFNAHFWRFFDTGDAKDYLLDQNNDKTFYMLGYYEIYDINNRSVLGLGERTSAAMSDDHMITMGQYRDLTTELDSATSLMTTLGSTALALAAILLS